MFAASNRNMGFPMSSSPSNSRILLTVNIDLNQSHSSAFRIKKPTLLSEPLSPDLACTTYPSGARVVGPRVVTLIGSLVSYVGWLYTKSTVSDGGSMLTR
ncbi:hypothetical protein CCHR01_00237 [Colletotrichum chrysophilum]|uniref:Uncharacterized protein n=1 Tax=Colletotrichum chrysophilum TaxID=1836956 RepID=A0AAD9EQW1_9PEZI|nr:hypothetical protein CCHR01_00237 [Colletotrichum chrysophilum]